jgi:CRISPR-associated exonuclease Cas4
MDEGLPGLPIRGIEVNYYVVCSRKCWWFQRKLEQEKGFELVELGRLTHEQSFTRQIQKGIDIEGFVRLDFVEEGIVHEVKHGRRMERAHKLQLLYYLYLLRQRGVETKGVLHFPRQRRRQVVELTPEGERELETVLKEIQDIRAMQSPPSMPERRAICRSCAYEELCWCDTPAEGELSE